MSTGVLARRSGGRARVFVVVALVLLVLAVAVPVFIRLSNPVDVVSDIPQHAGLARKMVQDGGWISYSLWYPLMYLTTGGAGHASSLQVASVVFLTLATLARTLVAYYLIVRATGRQFVAAAGGLLALLAMPLMNPGDPTDIYLGQVTATVWHNSTNILVAPFALAAFAAAVALLRDPSPRTAELYGLAALLMVLMKPNYALALLPVVGIVLLVRLWRLRTRFAAAVRLVAFAFGPVAIVLAIQYLLVYRGGNVRQTHLAVARLVVWEELSENIPLSLFLSLLGPALVLVALRLRGRIPRELALAWAVLVVAICQLAFLAEVAPNGAVDLDGNLFWGSYTALLVVMVCSVIALARAFPTWPDRRADQAALTLAIGVLTLHIASGVVYVLSAGTPGFPVA